jgi:hypothetical protein
MCVMLGVGRDACLHRMYGSCTEYSKVRLFGLGLQTIARRAKVRPNASAHRQHTLRPQRLAAVAE